VRDELGCVWVLLGVRVEGRCWVLGEWYRYRQGEFWGWLGGCIFRYGMVWYGMWLGFCVVWREGWYTVHGILMWRRGWNCFVYVRD